MLALNKAQIDLKKIWTQNLKNQNFGKCNRIFFSYLTYYKLVANVVFCCYYVIVETCAHQYLTAVIVLLMQSSFSQNHEIPNSWQSYIVKRQEKETENSQIFWKKRTRPSSCQFSSPLPFFSTTYLYCARHFFVQTTSGYYVFFLRPSKTEKFIHPWFWLSL